MCKVGDVTGDHKRTWPPSLSRVRGSKVFTPKFFLQMESIYYKSATIGCSQLLRCMPNLEQLVLVVDFLVNVWISDSLQL